MNAIQISKPAKEEKDRFSGMTAFAKGDAAADDTAKKPAVKSSAKKASANIPKMRNPAHNEPMIRENFDMEESLCEEMRNFVIQSKRFRYKREFLIQCVKDGLKKYKDE